MYRQESIKPYSEEGDKKSQVKAMFDSIAPTYDLLNHRMSFDIDKRWRRRAIASLKPYHPQRILDVATGTGDFALLAAKELSPARIDGVDISEGMMQIASGKVEASAVKGVDFRFSKMDSAAMTFPDNTFDAVISAFGIRNFQDLDKSLSEMCRVMKKGGRLSVVELSSPVAFPMRQLFRIYSHVILPAWGKLVARDKKAYSYLTRTIEAFPQGEQMTAILKNAGFSEVVFHRLTFGICTLYQATKK